MEDAERAEVPDDRPRRTLRVVDFPVDEFAQPDDPEELALTARLLGVTVDELQRQRSEDDVPVWQVHDDGTVTTIRPTPLGHGPKKESEMMNESNVKERVVTQGWDEVEKSASTGGAWMKWDDKQIHKLNVFGAPVHVEKSFNGDPPKQRVIVDVYVIGEGLKKWEMSPSTYKDLAEERRDCKAPFGDAVILVKRQGTGTTTQYKMRYERQLTPAEVAHRADLGGAGAQGGNGNSQDIPF